MWNPVQSYYSFPVILTVDPPKSGKARYCKMQKICYVDSNQQYLLTSRGIKLISNGKRTSQLKKKTLSNVVEIINALPYEIFKQSQFGATLILSAHLAELNEKSERVSKGL